MKQLRYILIVIGVLSVVAVSAATFGAPYTPNNVSYQPMQSQGMQAPTAQMRSTSAMSYSGSALPMAAATGVSTTYDSPARVSGRPRRAVDEDDKDVPKPNDNEIPDPTPIGDAVLPLMLLIGGYGMLVYFRRKRIAKAKG